MACSTRRKVCYLEASTASLKNTLCVAVAIVLAACTPKAATWNGQAIALSRPTLPLIRMVRAMAVRDEEKREGVFALSVDLPISNALL